MDTVVITNVRPWASSPLDIAVTDGIISNINTTLDVTNTRTIDGKGMIIIPSFADAHSHLDSTRLGLPYRPQTGDTTLLGRIMNDRNNWRQAEATLEQRATYALSLMIAKGLTHVRSHIQIDADCKFERVEGVLAAQNTLSNYADIQLVAFPQAGLLREPGNIALMDQALSMGIDLMGGIDPSTMDHDSKGHLDAVFNLAEKHQVGIDIHIHEPNDLGLYDINQVLDRVEALGMQGKVNISHAMALASGLPNVRTTIERMGYNQVSVTNVAPSKSVLPIKQLMECHVRVGLGMDGQRDYWHAYGNGDMLQRTWQLSFINGWDFENDITLALQVATWGGLSIINPEIKPLWETSTPGFEIGNPGDFLLLDATYISEAVMDWPTVKRRVIRKGQEIYISPQIIEQ